MTLKETLKQLKSLGNEKTRAHNTRYGAGDNQFGVKHGDIRALAKEIQPNHDLALSLWETGNVAAQLLAALIESDMAGAAHEVQWTMNGTLAAIGIHFPRHRKRAIAIGENLSRLSRFEGMHLTLRSDLD